MFRSYKGFGKEICRVKYSMEITESAKKDLKQILDYISETLCNKQAALKLLELVKESLNDIADIPDGFPLAKDQYLRNMGIRFVPVKNYIIFYTVDSAQKKVYIIRVMYGKRNWIEILKDDF